MGKVLREEKFAEVIEVTPIAKLNKPLPKKDGAPEGYANSGGSGELGMGGMSRGALKAVSDTPFAPAFKGPKYETPEISELGDDGEWQLDPEVSQERVIEHLSESKKIAIADVVIPFIKVPLPPQEVVEYHEEVSGMLDFLQDDKSQVGSSESIEDICAEVEELGQRSFATEDLSRMPEGFGEDTEIYDSHREYVDFKPIDSIEQFKELLMNDKLTRVVVVSTNLDGEDLPSSEVKMEDIAEVFLALEGIGDSSNINPSGSGAFSFEPSVGLWDYLIFIVRETRGLIASKSSVVYKDDKCIMFVSLDEYRRAITEWEVLIDNSQRGMLKDLGELRSELVRTRS